jgi:hypothetical protein
MTRMTTTLTLNGPAIRLAIEREQEDILASAGIFLQDRMVSATPEDTGRARGSITYATSRRQSRPRFPALAKETIDAPVAPNVVHIGTNLWYFRFLEFGTRKHERRLIKRRTRKDLPSFKRGSSGSSALAILRGTFERSRSAVRHLFIVGYNAALEKFN